MLLSHSQLYMTSGTVARQAPLPMESSRQECQSGLPFPSLGDLPDPGIESRSPALQACSLPSKPPGKPIQFNAHNQNSFNEIQGLLIFPALYSTVASVCDGLTRWLFPSLSC